MSDDGFHDGELLAQRRAGVVAEAQRLGRMLATPEIGEGMSRFVAERELAFLTAEDGDGRLWTSPIVGPPGFCRARGRSLAIAGTPGAGDPLRELRDGRPAGVLLVDFARRRRLRVNGVVRRADREGLTIAVEQAFGNCPRHITPHRPIRVDTLADGPVHPARRGTRLEPAHLAQIAAADTFVLGTLHPGRGADTSHRGGAPGFVRFVDGQLWWPDYPGNNLFNSIGNLVVNPVASMLFLDFDRRTTVALSGRATVEWTSGGEPGPDEQTGRRIRFIPEAIVGSTVG